MFCRYEALDATIKTMKTFSDKPMFLQTMSFNCGGNFTFETETEQGFERGYGNPNIQQAELNDKLVIVSDRGVEDWTITPDTCNKPTKIDFMEMLKDQARSSQDRPLLDAVDFLSQYKESHSHFIVLGAQYTLSNLLKEMKTKPRLPSTFLNPNENVVLSCITLDDFPQLDIHEGSNPMFCLCVRMKRREEDTLKYIRSYLDCIDNVPLNRICLMVFGADVQNESRSDDLKNQVKDWFGISKSLEFRTGNLSDLATELLNLQAVKEETIEYRDYADYKIGKVINQSTKVLIN